MREGVRGKREREGKEEKKEIELQRFLFTLCPACLQTTSSSATFTSTHFLLHVNV